MGPLRGPDEGREVLLALGVEGVLIAGVLVLGVAFLFFTFFLMMLLLVFL